MYIVTFGAIYQLYFNAEKQRVFGHPIYVSQGLCAKGRWHLMAATDVNHLLGFELLDTATFPVVTKASQRLYEDIIKRKADGIPMICGSLGRACRQLGKAEGANRANCQSCPLARFAAINFDGKDS